MASAPKDKAAKPASSRIDQQMIRDLADLLNETGLTEIEWNEGALKVRVTKGGASPSTNDLGGYSILQAESKEALAETLKDHPHFMMPDGSIEVVELLPVPGA